MPTVPSPNEFFEVDAVGPLAQTIPTLLPAIGATIAAGGSYVSSVTAAGGFSVIAAAAKLDQAGTLSIQRYLDAAGTIPQGAPVSVALTANTLGNLNVSDGLPFQSFKLTLTNGNGAAAANVTQAPYVLLNSK